MSSAKRLTMVDGRKVNTKKLNIKKFNLIYSNGKKSNIEKANIHQTDYTQDTFGITCILSSLAPRFCNHQNLYSR